jgi:cation transport protein ChaC
MDARQAESRRGRRLALTAEHVARVHRVGDDLGPIPGRVAMTDADYDRLATTLLAELGDAPFWVFAAGSLIWKPDFAHVAQRPATLHGWHRSFCLRITRWRGTPEFPGLMMGIDRGGSCRGAAFLLPPGDRHEQMQRLLRREISYTPAANAPGWHMVRSGGERFKALAFTASKRHPAYCHGIPEAEVAYILARAFGHWGSGAEYLYNTVSHLDAMGIRDRNLWRLQRRVAEEIEKL